MLLVVLGLAGCAGGQQRGLTRNRGGAGVWYTVKAGDTLALIAQQHRTPVQAIAEWNNLQNPDLVPPGKKLFIPFDKQGKRLRRGSWGRGREIRLHHGKFAWPVDGPLNSGFGMRHGRRHDGLDIGAKKGTPIRAAAAGVVAFEGKLAGYGNLVIVRHPDRYYTAYAHNARHHVRKGERVRQGEVIAKVGTTGRTTGPHLHFEVRHGQQARNPLFFLEPKNRAQRRMVASARKSAQAPRGRAVVAQAGSAHRHKWQKFVPRPKRMVQVNKPFRRARRGD